MERLRTILVTVDLDDVIAVADEVVITGQVVDNQLIGLADHMVTLEVDGVNIGEVTTEADGSLPTRGWFRTSSPSATTS